MAIAPIEWYKKIKALLKIKSEVEKMKLSELQTSEGRLTLLGSAITIYAAVQGILPPPLSAKIAGGLILGYTVMRGLVKAAEVIVTLTKSTKDDAIVAEINQILELVKPKTN